MDVFAFEYEFTSLENGLIKDYMAQGIKKYTSDKWSYLQTIPAHNRL